MFVLLLLLWTLAEPVFSQVASGTLLGEVRDESAALVPGARITARHEPTGFSRTVLTGAVGSFRIDLLVPGAYTVLAQKEGFAGLTVTPVTVEVNQKAKLDLVLKVGTGTESITVTADASPLQGADASAGYRLDHSEITALPLAVRNVIALATLGPGVIPRQLGGFVHDVVNDAQEGRGAVALNPPINGARSTMNSYLLDGAMNTDRNTFAIAVNPPLDAVQEFRIQTSLPSAEFSQAGGGVVDVVTRSGGTRWHGSAFEYLHNEATDAFNFFDDPSLPRPVFRQNQFGGSLGGALPLPSTFFFATYEGLRGKVGTSSLNIVPDSTLRSGDFRGRNVIFDPLNPDPITGQRSPFPDNVIPAGRLDAVAKRFLALYEPLPNRSQGTSNFLDSTPNENSDDNVSARIDRGFRRYGRVFGRYTLNEQRGRVGAAFPVRPFQERIRSQQAAVGHTLAGSGWFNEARFSFTRLRVFDVPENAFRNNAAHDLGISGLPDDPFTYGLPFFLVTNFSTVTDSPSLPQTQRDNLRHVADGMALLRGRHTVKFGLDWIHFQLNYLQTWLLRGQYIFTGAFTANAASPEPTGDPFADFLLGFPQNTNRNIGATQAYLRQNSYAGYLQDDWRLSRRLTVNAGLRYEYTSPYREARGRLLNLDYSTLPDAPRLVRTDSGVEPDRNNVSPRIGLALRPLPTRDLVFRAGYGIYYSPEIATETYDLIRNGVRNESNATDGNGLPVLTTSNGFPQTASTGFPGYYGLDPHARTPYVQQWSATIQTLFPSRIVLEIGYLGSKGTHLGRFRQFNTPFHEATGENLSPRPGDLQQLRPWPELGKIIQRQHIANSSYNSLQIKAEKRMVRRVSLLASFVWSKSIDDADGVIPGQYDSVGAQDERNLRLERGLSFFNVGRRLSAGWVVSLPELAASRRVLAGWELSGIATLQDGTPLNPVYFAYDGANTGTPNRPDVVPGVSVVLPRSQRTADRFFNTDAFSTPKPYTLGNAGRNILPGPGNNIFNVALHRRFVMRESRTAEFRTEFLNAFNHPNFGIPGPYPDFGPFFGKVFSTGDPRRIQFALRFDF